MIRPVLEAVARIGRPPVRVVSPAPPHAPEPYPDEPFAPAYDYVPLGEFRTTAAGLGRTAARADVLVFGPQYPRGGVESVASLRCGPCGVSWAMESGTRCWNCGRPG